MARRDLEHDELPFPNGWFAVAFSTDLIVGGVQPIHYFGEDMVLFRTRSGEARVLDAWCPHLGAHLGHGGRVVGETVRCPFHGWQWDGSTGRCAAIPYCEKIPPNAKTRAWDVLERNGMIFIWRHEEEKPPDWDFPVMEEIGSPDWSEPRTFELVLDVNSQDMHENNNDPVHFQFVHRMLETPPTEIEYSAGGRHYRITSTSEFETPVGPIQMTLERDSWGLGLTAVRMVGFPEAGLLMYSSTTPIEKERTISRWLLTASNNIVDLGGEEFMRGLTEGVKQDLPIWQNKVHRKKPLLCEADGHLAEFRKWVKQFYSEVAGREADPAK